jgi:hypothetical protein
VHPFAGQLRLSVSSFLLAMGLALSAPAAAGLEVAVDHNGDGLLQALVAGDPRVPPDTTSPQRPFVFWLNTDQDDLEYYETWPLARADYETGGIDSLRDLEDFTRLAVRLDADSDLQRLCENVDLGAYCRRMAHSGFVSVI